MVGNESFYKQKRELNSFWKKIKTGMIKSWKDIPDNYQDLLLRYYPWVIDYLGARK